MSSRASLAVPTAIILIAGASMLLTACASTVMKTYIGAPITSVMLDYGPPDNIYSLGPGQQAFQWRKKKTQVVAGSSSARCGQRGAVSDMKCRKRQVMLNASIAIIRSIRAVPATSGT